jgi:mannose-6-phosphate isomerase
MSDKASPPWGEWEVLVEGAGYKVKRIRVRSGHRLSYQKHEKRQEHWTIVEGAGRVTLDGKEIKVRAGESIDIPKGSAHRMQNLSKKDLVFIEIQTGDYFGEDDIVRLEDDYGRSSV